MNLPFVDFYFDEDVSSLVAEMLQSRGFSVLTTQEASNLGQSDRFQLEYATMQSRVLVTHNRIDFENLAAVILKTEPHITE